MKKRILKGVLAVLIIASLTINNFLVIGLNIVEAVNENLENQAVAVNSYIDYDVYFKNGESKDHSVESSIKEGTSLYININVKDTGVALDAGKIKIENSNFELGKVKSTAVKSINYETKEIELNEIIYGNNVEIELPITFKKNENVEVGYFDAINKVALTGTYRKGTSSKEVSAERKVELKWTEKADIEVAEKIEKYMLIENKGVLLQDSIEVNVINNVLPKQNESITIIVPQIENKNPDKVIVLKNGEDVENKNYDSESGKLSINTENKTWKNGKDEYKIIYLYYEAREDISRNIKLSTTVETKLYTQENKITKTNEEEVEVSKIGNIASVKNEITEEQYKGYIYANTNKETEYEEISTVEISNANVESIEIILNEDYFVNANGNKYSTQNSTYFKETRINKNEVLKVFGENANVSVRDNNENILKIIDSETETDENGDVVIKYREKVEGIKIKTNTPQREGTLKIYNEKAIKGQTGYTKEQLKQVTGLEANAKLIADENVEEAKAEMILKDTETEAEITLSQTGLSTLNENNVKMDINLKTDDNKYDLYKNPTIKIKLPTEVTGVEINSINQLYKKQLNLKDYNYDETTKTINIAYEGEQTEFGNASNEGMFIEVDAKIRLNKLATTRASEIVMTYTNENGNEREYEEKVDVNINSKAGILTYTSVSGYNEVGTYVESVGDEVQEGRLDEEGSKKLATAKMAIINNYNVEVNNVEVIGEIAENTFIPTLAGNIKTGSNAKIYYSEDGDNWKEEVEDLSKVRKYKVVPENNKIEAFGSLTFVYGFNIPENLGKEQSTYTNYEIKYNYAEQEAKASSKVILSTEAKEKNALQQEITNVAENDENYEGTTETIDGLELNYKAISNGKELKNGEAVKEGQSIKYVIKVKNVSGKDINNFKVIAEQTNAIFYGPKSFEAISVTDEPAYNVLIEEDESLANKEFTKEVLKAEEDDEFSYEFTVKPVGEGEKTEGKIKVSAEDKKETEVKLNTNEIEEGKLKLVLESCMAEDWEFTSYEYNWWIVSKVTNIYNETLKDVTVEIPLQDWVKTSTYEINEAIDENCKFTLVDYKDNIITFNIEEINPNEEIQIPFVNILSGMDKNKTTEQFRLNSVAYISGEEDVVYTSNEIQKEVKQYDTVITVEQTSDKAENEILEENEEVTFNAVIKNEGAFEKEITITDNIAKEFTVVDAYYEFNGETKSLNTEDDVTETIKPDEVIKLTVKAKANNLEDANDEITNEFEVLGDNTFETSNTLKYRVASANNNNIEESDETENEATSYYDIEGTVWEDKNKNGVKDDKNSSFAEMNIYLLDATTGEVVSTIKTEEDGSYDFSMLSSGKYIVAYEYDTTKYRTTTYKKADVLEENNSNVITKEININGETKKMAVTDIIEITDRSISSINAGFAEKEVVDFKLDKYVTKVTLQNNKGTTVKEYKNSKLAKLEINPKEVDKSLVLIEYTINVTNEGELAGYVGEILDYIPNDLKFSSEINKDWYVSTDGTLHNITLANERLSSGETKQVKLILTKTMTEDNLGLIINNAEIGKASNEFDIEDIDSTPSNKVDKEDDQSKAEVIVSLTTGKEMIIIISTSLIAMIVMGLIIKIARRKEGKDE